MVAAHAGVSRDGADLEARVVVESSEVEPQLGAGEIEVRVRAEAGQLFMLRAVAETVLLSADFTLDVVTDVRVALDEVATALIGTAVPDSALDCEFHYDADAIGVAVRALTESGAGPVEGGLGWHMLEALTDAVESATEPYDPQRAGYPVTVRFTRFRRSSR
ncbi:anti-sigma factor [Nocardia sp. NBC_00511]|uniref:anti-sigma factor n=1 Tax=Nocardia sp. NBC_00511 TaxID=2903591 RepID=UPI0030DFCA1A